MQFKRKEIDFYEEIKNELHR